MSSSSVSLCYGDRTDLMADWLTTHIRLGVSWPRWCMMLNQIPCQNTRFPSMRGSPVGQVTFAASRASLAFEGTDIFNGREERRHINASCASELSIIPRSQPQSSTFPRKSNPAFTTLHTLLLTVSPRSRCICHLSHPPCWPFPHSLWLDSVRCRPW